MLGRRREEGLTWASANHLIAFIMKMDAKLDRVLELLEEDDGEEDDA